MPDTSQTVKMLLREHRIDIEKNYTFLCNYIRRISHCTGYHFGLRCEKYIKKTNVFQTASCMSPVTVLEYQQNYLYMNQIIKQRMLTIIEHIYNNENDGFEFFCQYLLLIPDNVCWVRLLYIIICLIIVTYRM